MKLIEEIYKLHQDTKYYPVSRRKSFEKMQEHFEFIILGCIGKSLSPLQRWKKVTGINKEIFVAVLNRLFRQTFKEKKIYIKKKEGGIIM